MPPSIRASTAARRRRRTLVAVVPSAVITTRDTLNKLGLLGLISAVAGLLLAGMLLPIVGGVGLIARTGANDFESLPAELRALPLPQVSRIVAANGKTLATFYFQNRVPVTLDQVPPVMQRALIAVEDVRFYEHHGVDFKGALRALFHNGTSGSVQQGGSTLTQQYVKNVLTENALARGDLKAAQAAHADTLTRKVKEARLALALEQKYTKQQILQSYLNIAYFGDGAYGVGTAARHYFDEPVSKLTLAQAALLAGLVQSPEAYDPRTNPTAAKDRRDVVLSQMLKYHFISDRDYTRAVALPIKLHLHVQGNGCETSSAPYFCDYVQHVIENSPAFGPTVAARKKLLLQGGLTIHTTLEPRVQKAADHAVRDYVHPRDPSGIAGAEAVVEPGTGKVLALSVSKPYGQDAKKGENTLDYAVDRKYGGGTRGFPAGSTFKLFVLAAALKQGIPLSTRISAPQSMHLSGFTDCNGNDAGTWDVHNAGDSEAGTFDLVNGTWYSVNTFFAQLEQRTGLCQPVKLAEAMGVRQESGDAPIQYPSFTLGANPYGYSALDIAGAYATMAAHGQYCAPIAITKVTDRTGRNFKAQQEQCSQAVEPGLADTVTNILHGVLTKPGATAYNVGEPGRPAAAKTGTAENSTASNFAGYVPQMAAAVWVGDPKRSTTRSLNGLKIGGRYYGEVFGATIAGPIWRDTMAAALRGVPVEQLPPPDPRYVNGLTKPVPDVSGLLPSDALDVLKAAGFKGVVAPGSVPSLFPQGTVAYTSPPGGGGAPPGVTVTIYLSNGTAPKPSPTATPSSGKPSKPPKGPGPSPSPSTSSSSCKPKPHGPPHC
jgi:membrane peptidoglycan carboxypeptidase